MKPKVLFTDGEGPIVFKDLAADITEKTAPGLFPVLSFYDDYLAEVGTEGYQAGDTLALIAPHLIAHGVTDQDVENEAKDAKVELVRLFFAKHNSPLEPFSQDIIDTANIYGIDFRLLPAIAMQESNLCKKAPVDSYNCWGFGIYGKKVTRFESYKEAIYAVTKTLSKQYKNRGLKTPEEIMTKYTPSNKGDWAYSVNHFVNLLK